MYAQLCNLRQEAKTEEAARTECHSPSPACSSSTKASLVPNSNRAKPSPEPPPPRNRHTRRTALPLPSKYRNHHSRQTLATNNLLALRKYTLPCLSGVRVGRNTAQIFARLSAPYPKRCTLRSGNQRPRRSHLGLGALVPTITMRPRRRRNSILVRKANRSKMHHPTLFQRTRNLRFRSVVRGRYVQRKIRRLRLPARIPPTNTQYMSAHMRTRLGRKNDRRCEPSNDIQSGREPSVCAQETRLDRNRTLRTGRTLLRRRRTLEQNLPGRRGGKNKQMGAVYKTRRRRLLVRKGLARRRTQPLGGLSIGASFTGLHAQHEIRMHMPLCPRVRANPCLFPYNPERMHPRMRVLVRMECECAPYATRSVCTPACESSGWNVNVRVLRSNGIHAGRDTKVFCPSPSSISLPAEPLAAHEAVYSRLREALSSSSSVKALKR